MLPFSRSLTPFITVLLVGRLVALAIHLYFMVKVVPSLRDHLSFNYELTKPVLHFGSWITLSNVVSPVMMNMDRFFIGSLLSVAAVTYYAAPFEAVTKLLLLPGAVASVLFPAFALSFAGDRDRMALLLSRGVKYVFLAVFPIVLVFIALAPELLGWWLGPVFAERSSVVLRWLAAGVFINCLVMIPSVLIHATGRPDVTAKFHLMELPLYLLAIWFLIRNYGIDGAAWAWSLRVALDSILIAAGAAALLPQSLATFKRLGVATAACLGILLVSTFPSTLAGKGLFLFVALSIFTWVAWTSLLSAERAYVRPRLSVRRFQHRMSRP